MGNSCCADRGDDELKRLAAQRAARVNGVLKIEIESASNLPAADSRGTSDPFVEVTLVYLEGARSGEELCAPLSDKAVDGAAAAMKRKTKTEVKTLNPTWKESFEVPLEDALKFVVHCRVCDFDPKQSDAIGVCQVPVLALLKATQWPAGWAAFLSEQKSMLRDCEELKAEGASLWKLTPAGRWKTEDSRLKMRLQFDVQYN
eukprot:GDKI01046725.1.p1 GENE.GDKI01046725.1~~GDKI01046725.1.p1  ORF type:complete len:202 (+),score=53.27 GDKI01046725.1:146-751(+)